MISNEISEQLGLGKSKEKSEAKGEAKGKQRGKWILVDSFHSLYFVDPATREPLSVLEIHDRLLSLGTSATVFAHSQRPVVDPEGAIAAFCDSTGGWLPLLCTLNCTFATELMRQPLDIALTEFDASIAQIAPSQPQPRTARLSELTFSSRRFQTCGRIADFLKNAIGREPNAFLSNYRPAGGSIDKEWKDGRKEGWRCRDRCVPSM